MTMHRRTIALATVVALVAATMLLGGCTAGVAPDQMPNTVTADGVGTVVATPNQGVMTFVVSSQGKDVTTALNGVSNNAGKVVSAIKGAGIADKNVQTSQVSVETRQGAQSYFASTSITAKVTDLGTLPKVIGAASWAGVDAVSGPAFSLSDDTKSRQEALAKAIANARSTAEAAAKAAGKSLGGISSMKVTSTSGTTPQPGAAAGGSSANSGQFEVSVHVSAVFQMQ